MTRSCMAGFVVALAACAGGGETGNPVVPTRIDLEVRSSDPELIALSGGAEGTVLDAAWIAFGRIGFLTDEACANLGDLDVEGTTQVAADLAQPGAYVTIDVAPGVYCGMVVPLHPDSPALPDGAPPELARHSIVLRGARADGTPFLLTHPEQDELELAAVDAIEVAADGAGLLLSFDVATWMDGIALDDASIGSDGLIRIDADDNRALLDAFEVNLECSLELYADVDGDGEVGADDARLASCAPD